MESKAFKNKNFLY